MKTVAMVGLIITIPLACCLSVVRAGTSFDCGAYSDRFDYLDISRWQEVLLYSDVQGEVGVEDGQVVLRAHPEAPSEIQIYSLFTLEGDFDIQIDLKIIHKGRNDRCRFNAGLILQTAGDELSYKCYISKRPNKSLAYTGRVDRLGEDNQERQKGGQAADINRVRVVRKNGNITFYSFSAEGWKTQTVFNEPCMDNLRIRLKLQTSGDEEATGGCPAIVGFDNFSVNSCTAIVAE